MPKKSKQTTATCDIQTPLWNPCCVVNPGLGMAEVLITGGLVAVGVIGIVMGVRTIRQSPQMPPMI